MTRRAVGRVALYAAAGAILGFLALPLVALLATAHLRDLALGLADPLAGPALRLSLSTTAASLAILVVFGTALAWLLARRQGPVVRWIEILVQLPAVIPPAVAGLALLFAFGRLGLLGPLLARAGVSVAFTWGAVVLAQVFVSAPFYIQAAIVAFRQLDEHLLIVARSLGARPARVFFRVALPLAASGLWSGAALAWARALGEFGATLMFAGNMTGRTQTLSLAIYTALESDPRAARSLSLVLVVAALVVLLALGRRVPLPLLAAPGATDLKKGER